MSKSSSGSWELDFDRDLPTTREDIQALRSRRPIARLGDLKNVNRLSPPKWLRALATPRRPFADWPPFEL